MDKEQIIYKTIEEANVAALNLDNPINPCDFLYCPLANNFCRNDCVCFKKSIAKPIQVSKGPTGGVYADMGYNVVRGGCTNPMLGKIDRKQEYGSCEE